MTDDELMVMIDQYGSKRAIHSAIEATRVAVCRKPRGPLSGEIQAQEDYFALRAQIAAELARRGEKV